MDTITYYGNQPQTGRRSTRPGATQVRRRLCKHIWDGCAIGPVDIALEHTLIQKLNIELAEFSAGHIPNWGIYDAGFFRHVIKKHACRHAAESAPSPHNAGVFISAFILEIILKAILYAPTSSQPSPVQQKPNDGVTYYIHKKFESEIGHCGIFGRCTKWVRLIVLVPYGTTKIYIKSMFPVSGLPRETSVLFKTLNYNLQDEINSWAIIYFRKNVSLTSNKKMMTTPNTSPNQWPELGASVSRQNSRINYIN